MGKRWQRNYVLLSGGDRIRFSLFKRPDGSAYFVRFRGPGGSRLERSTGAAKMAAAVDAAHTVIRDEFQEPALIGAGLPWNEAVSRLAAALRANNNRPATIKGYIETLATLRAVLPHSHGPADVTAEDAEGYKARYSTGTFVRRRDPAPDSPVLAYSRTAKSVESRIRSLKAVFGWFGRLSPPLVSANPFAAVSLPETDRTGVRLVTRGDVQDVFRWLAERFPGWELPALFFRVKALTACRLDDLCQLRSECVRDGGVLWPADLTKRRAEHFAHLPADVYRVLDRYKGTMFVWERYPPELIECNRRKGYPTHRQNPAFSPRRMYLWVVQIMQHYQADTGRDFSSHDFRRAAFTRAAEQDIHPKKVATAYGVTPETMIRYYTAVEQREASREVGEELAAHLDPTA